MLGIQNETDWARLLELLEMLRENARKTIRLRIGSGLALIEMKGLFPHGSWLKWMVEHGRAGYGSVRTAQRDMELARSMGDRLDLLADLDGLSLTSVFELCRSGADERAIDTAIALSRQGMRVKAAHARSLVVLYETHPDLGEKVRDGEMTLIAATELTGALDSHNASDSVTALVKAHCPSAPVVEALCVLEREAPDEFEGVVRSGTIFNPVTEFSIPLKDASQNDAIALANTAKIERIARQHEHIRSARSGERVASLTGTAREIISQLRELLSEQTGEVYRVYAYRDPIPDPA